MTAPDTRRAAQQRAARRALVRAHHPDLGGDPDTFVAALASLEAPARPATTVVRTSRARRRRGAVRRIRARLPRGLPGARRYGTY